jgi:hypothetical protein
MQHGAVIWGVATSFVQKNGILCLRAVPQVNSEQSKMLTQRAQSDLLNQCPYCFVLGDVCPSV